MISRRRCVVVVCAVACLALAGYWLLHAGGGPDRWVDEHRLPRIRPDYAGTVIPPNIAPLNFVIDEPGIAFRVRIHGDGGEPIEIASGSASIRIPPGKWRGLLRQNRGGRIGIEVFVEGADGPWSRFDTIENTVAQEAIDSHLAYRLLGAVFTDWGRLGIFQRDLESYDERPILRNTSFQEGCVNCHSFAAGNCPGNFSFHVRPPSTSPFTGGMILVRDGLASRVRIPRDALPALPTYTSWHPRLPLAAVSLNRAIQFLHGAGEETREVPDLDSDLAVIDARTGGVRSAKGIADPHRIETFPCWSPDGRYLYFSSAPIRTIAPRQPPFAGYDMAKLDLMRIRYDAEADAWETPQCVLSAAKTGLSILEPRVSPDGRFLLFCMCDHGAFPILERDTDLYLMDLTKGGQFPYRPLASANSPQADSWHCWSSDSRWIVFSSKRDNGLLARPYLCYLDTEGKEHKPFVLPQRDPLFYDTCLKTYNTPELVCGPIRVSEDELARAILSEAADDAARTPPADPSYPAP